MDKEIAALKEELLRLVWWMRGGLTYDMAFELDQQEKQMINKIIKDNLETTKKSGLPFF